MQIANATPSAQTSNRWLPVVDRLVECAFHALVFALPLVFYVEDSFKIFEFAKLRLLYSATAVIYGGWALSAVLRRRFVIYRTPLDIPLGLYVLALAVSTALSTNVPRSLWGQYGSPSGALVPNVTCIALFFAYVANIRTRRQLTRSLWCLVAGGTVTAGWGVLQHYGLDWMSLDELYRLRRQSYGTMGNPAPQGWYLTLILPVVAWLFFEHRGRMRVLTAGIWCLLVMGMLSAGSRSGLVGAFAGLACLGIALAALRRKQPNLNLKPMLALAVLFVLAAVPLFGQKNSADNLTYRASLVSLKSSAFERYPLWRDAILLWRVYPVWGSGPHTFGDQHSLIRSKEMYPNALRIFGHAHNEYLQHLATVGVAGLAAYLLVIGAFLTHTLGIIRKLLNRAAWAETPFDLIWPIALAGGVVSILASQSFNPDFLATTLTFYLLPAMAMGWAALETDVRVVAIDLSIRPLAQVAAVAVILFDVGLALDRNVELWSAHLSYRRAIEALEHDRIILARDLIDRAVSTDPADANYWWVKAQTYADLAVAIGREDKGSLLIRTAERVAVASSDRSVALDPAREDLWRQRSICFRDLGEVDPAQLPVAIDAINQAIARFPMSGLNYLFLARLEARSGHRDAAVQALVTTINLSPTSVIAHAELATLYYRMGNRDAAATIVNRFLGLAPRSARWNLVNRLRDEAAMAGDEPNRAALEAYLHTMPRPRR